MGPLSGVLISTCNDYVGIAYNYLILLMFCL